MLSGAITSLSGSSEIFDMGLITYSNNAKTTILRIPKQIIKKYGAVSKQCCLLMVKNLNKISKSNICLSITGIAGPNGGNIKKPVGLVYIGIKRGSMIEVHEFFFKNKGRRHIQKAAVKKSLNLILSIIK